VKQDRHNQKPNLALVTIGFFVLLLVSSAPHRVHHIFEELGVSPKNSDDAASPTPPHSQAEQDSEHDDAGHEHDHNSGGSAKADCVAQAIAQNSHVAPAQATEVDYLELASKTQPAVTLSRHCHFSPSPFSQRAPP
jgi:hypothetical protein